MYTKARLPAFLLLLICVFAAGYSRAATLTVTKIEDTNVYTWQQTTTGDWQAPENWAPARTSPAPNDVLLFNTATVTTVTNVPTQTIGQLIVSGNMTVNLQSAGPVVLTIAGGDGADLTVAPNSALNFNGDNPIVCNLAIGTTGSISGFVRFSSSSSAAHRLTAVDASSLTFNNGGVFVTENGFMGNPFGTTNLNSITFDSGSVYVCMAGGDPFGATEPASVVVFKEGSLFCLQGNAGTTFFSGRTYANFELNYPGGDPFAEGSSPLIMNDLILTAGQFHYWMTGTGHRILGNIMTQPGTRLDMQATFQGQTITFNGPGAANNYRSRWHRLKSGQHDRDR